MSKEKIIKEQWLGRDLSLKTGLLAKQADASVVAQYGETVVMATVVQSKNQREGIDYFPLMVDIEEKLYAAGIIKGSRWVKREGRPTDESVLTGRMIDRSIRPLFNEEERRDVQVIITVLSVDEVNDHDIVSLIATSAALKISGVDWNGPIGGIRVGMIDNKLIFNPTYEERKKSPLSLIVVGDKKKTVMIESSSEELNEDLIFKAINEGQKELQGAIDIIEKFQEEVGIKEEEKNEEMIDPEEIEKEKEEKELLIIGEKWLKENIEKNLFNQVYHTKNERKMVTRVIKEELDKYLFSKKIEKKQRQFIIKSLADKMIEAEVSQAIIKEKKRIDGRALNEIRELSAKIDILPRNHGAGLFSRGETQILSIVTLGAPGLEQYLEGIEGESKKRFMHHYNFPPYSVGEAKPLRGAGRREIGHGALAEKALLPVLPNKEDFPYAIRVVSETLGSNGSSSMGSTCGSSLALMDAGVPIKRHVAGIAIGLASNEDMSEWQVLTDIQDLEDGKGGMDFKITGTREGITAIQLDTKTNGLNEDIIKEALSQGREALNKILDIMEEEIPEPRKELSSYAPIITSFKVDPEKIGAIIGPGGKIINKIIDETEASIDIDDDGLVMITANKKEKGELAEKMVKEIIKEFEIGEITSGKVVRIMDFGAFVEIPGSQDGMVHISELAPYRVEKPSDIVNIGDKIKVRVKNIDDQGRISLSMKELEENEHLWKDRKGESKGNNNNRNSNFKR
jgi:polyribonucleotide nucleotidyltransferase